MNKAFLLTGSNLGDRRAFLQQAVQMVEERCGKVVNQSAIYETAAWGYTNQPSFYNQALELETKFTAEQLMTALLDIEKTMGRIRLEKLGPRVIDLDILLFNDDIMNSPLVTVPHPHLIERRFALTALDEIAGNLVHPVTHTTIQQLLIQCSDTLDVYKIS